MLRDSLLHAYGLVLGWMAPQKRRGKAIFVSLENALELPPGALSRPWLPNKPRDTGEDAKGSPSGHRTLLLGLLPGPKQVPGLATASLLRRSCASAAAVPRRVELK